MEEGANFRHGSKVAGAMNCLELNKKKTENRYKECARSRYRSNEPIGDWPKSQINMTYVEEIKVYFSPEKR